MLLSIISSGCVIQKIIESDIKYGLHSQMRKEGQFHDREKNQTISENGNSWATRLSIIPQLLKPYGTLNG